MSDLGHKILKIVIGELIGAFVFIICLLVLGTLPNDEISSQLTKIVIILWAIYGIGTPIAIFAEIEDKIFKIFQGIKIR